MCLLLISTLFELSLQFLLYDFSRNHSLLGKNRQAQLVVIIFSVFGSYYIIISMSVIIGTMKFRKYHMMFKLKQDYRATLVSQFLVAIAGTCYYLQIILIQSFLNLAMS